MKNIFILLIVLLAGCSNPEPKGQKVIIQYDQIKCYMSNCDHEPQKGEAILIKKVGSQCEFHTKDGVDDFWKDCELTVLENESN